VRNFWPHVDIDMSAGIKLNSEITFTNSNKKLVGVCKTFLFKVYHWRARITFSVVVCPRTAYLGHFTIVCEANRIIHIMSTNRGK
jgi:hypothetical protein